jgi:hypothetical protein
MIPPHSTEKTRGKITQIPSAPASDPVILCEERCLCRHCKNRDIGKGGTCCDDCTPADRSGRIVHQCGDFEESHVILGVGVPWIPFTER